MIKKLLSVLVLVFALSGSMLAQQSMSDQQVLEYVKTGMQQGKDQRQIATELARRGVTQEQAKRVKKLYEQQNGSADKDANAKKPSHGSGPIMPHLGECFSAAPGGAWS